MPQDKTAKKSGNAVTGFFKKSRTGSAGGAHRSTESLVLSGSQQQRPPQNTAAQQSGNASSNTYRPPQQRSYANAAGSGSKRPGPSPPATPRPQLVRGKPVLEDSQYASMERPAPTTASPLFLYLDLRKSVLSAEEALNAAADFLKDDVIGFQHFAAQNALALIFSKKEARDPYLNKMIPDTDLMFYDAPTAPCKLMKLMLQGVPVHDIDGLKHALQTQLAEAGKLVFLAPMVRGNLMSDQWHATISVNPDGSSPLPPEAITVLGSPVVIDIPGERRFCRHCNGTTHVKASCRQGQRIRARQQQQDRDQRQLDEFLKAQDTESEDPASWSSSSSTASNSTLPP